MTRVDNYHLPKGRFHRAAISSTLWISFALWRISLRAMRAVLLPPRGGPPPLPEGGRDENLPAKPIINVAFVFSAESEKRAEALYKTVPLPFFLCKSNFSDGYYTSEYCTRKISSFDAKCHSRTLKYVRTIDLSLKLC